MTREIKFRAKIKKTGEWFYFDLKTSDTNFAEIDWNTVCQFTGLHDKNGNPIYEGDIISMHNRQYNVVVEFTDYGYQGLHKQSGYYERLTTFIEDHEIIGDKYSNPELLN